MRRKNREAQHSPSSTASGLPLPSSASSSLDSFQTRSIHSTFIYCLPSGQYWGFMPYFPKKHLHTNPNSPILADNQKSKHMTNPKVDFYFSSNERWEKEI